MTQARVTSVSRSRLAQQSIQDRIKELILDQGLKTGDPMPTETELVEHLGISRNSVREALKALQALGIVEIRHGFGTYVGDCSLDPFADALVFRCRLSLHGDRHEVREIVDLREVLEVGLTARLLQVIDDAAIARLAACVDNMVSSIGNDTDFLNADRAFHEQLYAPLGNQLMGQLLGAFWDVYHDLSHELGPFEIDPMEIVESHRAIYRAVADRDEPRATAAVREHFRGIRERLQQ